MPIAVIDSSEGPWLLALYQGQEPCQSVPTKAVPNEVEPMNCWQSYSIHTYQYVSFFNTWSFCGNIQQYLCDHEYLQAISRQPKGLKKKKNREIGGKIFSNKIQSLMISFTYRIHSDDPHSTLSTLSFSPFQPASLLSRSLFHIHSLYFVSH